MPRINHKVTVRSIRHWDVPDKLSAFMAELQEAIGEIPEEYRDDARVEIDVDTQYDVSHADFIIRYYRPETDQEMTIREEREDRYRRDIEANERRKLAELKAKYETL